MDFARFNGTRHADVNLPASVGFNAPLKQPHLYPPLRNVHHLPLYFTLSTHLRPTPPSVPPPRRRRPRARPRTRTRKPPAVLPAVPRGPSPTSIPPNPLTTLPVDPIYVHSRARSLARTYASLCAPCTSFTYIWYIGTEVWYQNGRNLRQWARC